MLMINLIAFGLIIFIVYWFWLYKPKMVSDLSDGSSTIIVNNGIYLPSSIQLKAGKKSNLQFMLKDSNPCASTVQFPDLQMNTELSLNSKTIIELPALPPGRYEFHCQMKMYRGTLIVQ